MRIHLDKPFPSSFFDYHTLKASHYFVWWTLCNHVDAEEDGWIRIARLDLEKLIRKHTPLKSMTLTPLIKRLEEYGYLQLITHAPYRTYQIENYAILIQPNAWEIGALKRRIVIRDPAKQMAYNIARRARKAALKRTEIED